MDKVLVIVDVQKEFDEYIQHDLVDALSEYAEKFDTVYQIWDTHNGTVGPTHSFPNQIDSIPKKFGKKHFSDKVQKYIKNIEDSSDNGRTFKLSDDDGYIVRVKNNHDWFYVNPEIIDLISKIKDKKVILVGGADGECLEDIYQTFKAFGLKTHINKKYTYNAKTTEDDSVQEKILIPKPPKKKLNEERDNDAESAKEICVKVDNLEEYQKLGDILKEFDEIYFDNYSDTFNKHKAPYFYFFKLNPGNNRIDVVTFYNKENFEHEFLMDGGNISELENGVYKNIFDVDDDEETIRKSLLNQKVTISFKPPNYKPRRFIYESNNSKEDAHEIAVILNSLNELNILKNLLEEIDYGDSLYFVDSFPCVIYLNIKRTNASWGDVETGDYYSVINNDIKNNNTLIGVYERPFTIKDIKLIKDILIKGQIIDEIKPSYKPKKFLYEKFNPETSILVFEPNSEIKSEEAQKIAFSIGYLWGAGEKEVQYTNELEGKFLLFDVDRENKLRLLRFPVSYDFNIKLNNYSREEKIEYLKDNLNGNIIYTNDINNFKKLIGYIPDYKPKKFIY